ncbi:hypothetical protein FOH10_30290 [Nocardia otitidiscaviarum]|uniref:DUF3558 domain-containing protein n=1 Tax=Nocardia otitidiscaviarum TaxID=1823 RepID=A0A516NTZ7_9NOCA|nr:hypothetical protein [Nocardia otitidiscaviarum]MCP9621743.1 hypothetical protein [Nocardia otitidiscaviarum]QDP82382.1 hypothetical protein FOH10_30290 [Nocardia otitidiscaviarum]
MTGTNPPPGGEQNPGNHSETAQWWSTPPAAADAQPVAGDPTMLNYAPGQQVPDPTMLNQGAPQPSAPDPTMLNYGGGMGYTPPPQQTYQPGYTSGPAPVQQFAAGPAQPYTSGPAPQPGYPGYPTPPPSGGNKAGLIVGGIIGLVVIVAVAIGGIALMSGGDDSPNTAGGETENANADGKYTMDNVTNACSLIDPTALTRWSRTPEGSPTHTETQPTSYSGGKLECKASYTEPSSDKYVDNDADITLEVSFLAAGSKYYQPDPDYKRWKEYDTRSTGSGLASGDVTGLGEEGYWHTETRDSSYRNNLDYTVAVRDSNVSVKVEISIKRASADTISTEEVGQIAKEQVQKALAALPQK